MFVCTKPRTSSACARKDARSRSQVKWLWRKEVGSMAAASARTQRAVQALTELPAGAQPLEFVRRKRGREDAAAGDDNELRAVHISLGQVAQAAGSAYIEAGRAKLLCTVHGPLPDARAAHFSETGRLMCQVKCAAFCGLSEHGMEQLSRELPLMIRPALEAAVQLQRFPKSLLEVHVLVLEHDGDVCGPAITGASLALADSGIEMYDLVAACSVARSGSTGMLLDPTSYQLETRASGGTMTVAMMPARGEITQLSHVGEWDPDQYQAGVDVAVEACKQLHSLMRPALIFSVEAQSASTD